MSEFDTRPIDPNHSGNPSHLPAIPSQMPSALGPPLPAAPWIEANEDNGGFNFMGFVHALRRRWLQGLAIGVLAASTIAALMWLMLPVKHEAFVQIRVRRNSEEMLRDSFSRPQHPQDYEIEKQTQAALLRSPFVINAALRQPGISQMPIVRDKPWFGKRENQVAWLERQLKVEYAQGSEILRLSMRERGNSDDLKSLLNAVTDSYMKEIVFAERKEQRDKLNTLKERYRTLHKDITDQLDVIAELSETFGSTESEHVQVQVQMGYQELSSLDRQKHVVDQQFFEAYDAMLMHQKRIQANLSYQPQSFLIEDILLQYPEYASMKSQLIELEQAVKLGGQSRSAFNPAAGMRTQVSAIQQEMEQFRYEKKGEAVQRLRFLSNNDEQELQKEYDMLQARVTTLGKRRREIHTAHNQVSDRMRQMGAFSSDLQVRQLALESDKDTSDRIKSEIARLGLEMVSKPQIEVLERAIIPDESNWIMKYLQIIAAWGLTLIGTVLGIALWDMQLQRVNSSQEVIDSGEVRVIGTLPLLSGRRAGGLIPISAGSRRMIEMGLTRSIDSIRTALLFARKQQPYEVILVTSALGQEGKTTVASQLAVSFARSGRRTLLIDGDIRNPQQHIVLGMPMEKGLCDLLRSDVTLDDVVKPTPADGLWFLSTGYRDVNTDQYMASAVMTKLFAELRDRFDLIIVDTGPALTSPDAMLFGQHADATVISVRRDVSRLPKVHEACERLRSVGVQIAGSVLNGANADIRESEMSLPEPSASNDPQLEQADQSVAS